jgi:polysaccharide biosynthesis transport protein
MNNLPERRANLSYRVQPVYPTNSGDPNQSNSGGLNVREALDILQRKWWLVILVALMTSTPVVYLVLNEPPTYKATAAIRLVDSRRTITGGLEDATAERAISRNVDAIRSQMQILQSWVVLQEVVDKEGLRLARTNGSWPVTYLTDVSVFPGSRLDTLRLNFMPTHVDVASRQGRLTAPYGSPIETAGIRFVVQPIPTDLEQDDLVVLMPEQATEKLRRHLELQAIDKTDIIRVSYVANDPYLAQRIANRLVLVFQSSSARNAREQSYLRRTFLEDQLAATDSLLAVTRLSIATFRSKEQVYSSRETFAEQQQGHLSIAMRREELNAERQMYRSMLERLETTENSVRADLIRTLVSSPGIASNSVIALLYKQLAEYEHQLDTLTTGPNSSTFYHPTVQRVRQLISSTEYKLLDAIRSHLASLDARAGAIAQLLDASAFELNRLPTTEIEEVKLLHQAEILQNASSRLHEELHRAQMAEVVGTGYVEIVHPASFPLASESSLRRLKIALSVIFGILLGGGLALASATRRNLINRREDLEILIEHPSLAIIPPSAASGRGFLFKRKHRLVPINAVATPPRNSTSDATFEDGNLEAYRILRNSLTLPKDSQWKTLAVTSASAGDGKTTTATNLAISFASQRKRVLLIDCDLRNPNVNLILGVRRGPGIAEIFEGQCTVSDAICSTSVANLMALTAGSPGRGVTGDLITSGVLARLLRDVADEYDTIILDSPPLLQTADASIIATAADGVILIVRAGRTESSAATLAVNQLTGIGAKLLGVVINDPESIAQSQGDTYYYGYGSPS